MTDLNKGLSVDELDALIVKREYIPFLNPGWVSWLTLGKKGSDTLSAIRKGVQLRSID